jgi:hypothetical protein
MGLMETAQLLGNFGEFFGAIAVVITLLYVAAQVRHSKDATKANTTALELQSYQAWQAANLEINTGWSNSPHGKLIGPGLVDSRNLTEESFLSFMMMHLGMLQMAQSTDYLYRMGSLDSDLWEAEMDRAAGILSMPGVRQMWDAGARKQLTPRFVEFLESRPVTIQGVNWDAQQGFFHDSQLMGS